MHGFILLGKGVGDGCSAIDDDDVAALPHPSTAAAFAGHGRWRN
jgi:hypothetical protein